MQRPLLVLACLSSLACAADPAPPPAPSPDRGASALREPEPGPHPSRELDTGRGAPVVGHDPEGVLEAMAEDLRLQEEEKSALSAHYLRTGRRFLDEQDYRAAVRDLEKAVSVDMRNEEALSLLQRAHSLAGDEPAYAETLNALANEREAAVEERRHSVARWFREGEELMQAGRYAEAEQRFERVLEALRWSEVPLEPDSFRARAEANLVRAQIKGRDGALERRETLERDAADAAERERQR